VSALFFETQNKNPHRNLALEQYIAEAYPGEAKLMLWQNIRTVVIGAGQNAWAECDTRLLMEEGGMLARRVTGGGAVYHDAGNLNFSFIMPPGVYDVERQLRVILAALRSLKLDARFTGRNDLTIEGRKFSGNAFRTGKDSCLHHGTVMVNLDVALAARYLTVDPEKHRARGVKSVPARVVNLSEIAPDVTVEAVWGAIKAAFADEYGLCDDTDQLPDVNPDTLDNPRVKQLTEKYASWDWVFGETPRFDARLKQWFDWGGVTLNVELSHGVVTRAVCYSDAMDETLPARIGEALAECPWRARALAERAQSLGGDYGRDIASWLASARL